MREFTDEIANETRHWSKGANPRAAESRSGSITFITGCMFSGKTTVLLRRLDAFDEATVRAFKHVIDDRYCANAVVSHGGLARPAVQVAAAAQILAHIDPPTRVVAVDEAHFFDLSLVDVIRTLAARDLYVLVTSLNLSSWGQPFAVTERLRTVADEAVDLTARCARCGRTADHTQRLAPIVDGNLVGGPESYEPRCAKCWRPPPEPAPPQ